MIISLTFLPFKNEKKYLLQMSKKSIPNNVGVVGIVGTFGFQV